MRRWREGTSVCFLLWILLLPDFAHLQITTPDAGQNGVAPLDVVICLDSSSSMGEDNYNSLKAALVNFLQQMPVSEQLIRVGVRPFSWALCEELVQLTGNATALFEGVQRLPYMRGQTRTDLAIEDAIFQLSTYGRPGVAKAIVVLTDGMPTYPTEAMAMVQRAKKLDIEMFAVGFGSLVSVTGLYSLAPEGNVYREESFSQVPEGLLSFAKIQKEKAEATTQSATSLITGNVSTTITAFISETTTRPTTTTTSETTRNPSTTEAILRTAETSREPQETTTRKLGVEPQPGSTTSPETSTGFSSSSTTLNSGTAMSNATSTGTTKQPEPGPTTASDLSTKFSTGSTTTTMNSGTTMSIPSSTGTTEKQPAPTTVSDLSTRFSTSSTTTTNSATATSSAISTGTTQQPPGPTTLSELSTRFTSSTTLNSGSTMSIPSSPATTEQQQQRSTSTTDRILSSTAASISSTESRSSTDTKPTTVTSSSQGNITNPSSNSFRTSSTVISSQGNTSPSSNSFQTSSTVTSSQGITSPNSNLTTVTASQGSTSPKSFQTTTATPGQSSDSRITTPNSIQTSSTTASITTTTTATTTTTTTAQSTDNPNGDGECVEDAAGFGDNSKARASAGLTASNRRGKNGCILRQHKGGLCDRPEVRGAGGIGYISHPFNCARYIQCYPGKGSRMTAVTRVCGVGLFWNQESLRCDPAWMVPCFTDKCQQDISTRHYKMHSNNLRAFWYCQDGYSVPACCARGQGYFAGQGCVACSYCTEGCPADWRLLRSAGACDRRADPTSPIDYYMEFGVLGWMPATCFSGFFDLSRCTCSKDRLSLTDCTPHFFMAFDGRGNITYSNGQATTDNIVTANGYGIFMGDARVSVPMTFADILSRKAERPLRVKFQFMTSLSEGEGQVLVQSSPCAFGGLVVVYVDNTAIHARIFTQQGEIASAEVFTEGFNTTEWKNVQMRYSSSGFTMTVSSKQLTYSSFIKVPSYPSLSECGWTFGHPERLDHLSPLFGLLDNIEISYC